MTKEELLKKLIHLNVHPKYYSIGVEIKDNAYNIERLKNGQYAFYYLERGNKNDIKIFENEDDALSQLIRSLEVNIKNGLNLSN